MKTRTYQAFGEQSGLWAVELTDNDGNIQVATPFTTKEAADRFASGWLSASEYLAEVDA